ncbi:MAG: lysophospholipid acyltransferase family protein, partial [Methylococcales bacterium]
MILRWSWNNRPHWLRRLERKSAPYLINLLAHWLVKSYRIAPVVGQQGFERLLETRITLLPCFWHQQILCCAWFLIEAMSSGFKPGFLISRSKDGNMGARIFEFLGIPYIRGSSSSSGASSLREIYLAVKQQGLSVATAPDGPLGPARVFKEGWVNLARLTGAPMLPMAYAADHFWTLKTWDCLMIPKPFARVAIAVGNPVYAGKELDSLGLMNLQHRMEDELNELTSKARA